MRGGYNRGKKGERLSRNMYKGHMDKAKGGGLEHLSYHLTFIHFQGKYIKRSIVELTDEAVEW